MSLAVITGSAGLVGSESARFLRPGVLRSLLSTTTCGAQFFGDDSSTSATRASLGSGLSGYRHETIDIRDRDAVDRLFGRLGRAVEIVIHTAAQPSHDWAARDPHTDFSVNALGTLGNLLEATRKHSTAAAFIFTSTNKVYGDTPNRLPLVEGETRFDLSPGSPVRRSRDR